MTQFFFRLTAALSLLCIGVILATLLTIRAIPYDNSELREFLTPPEGCAAPCFMGIQPGVTTVNEAVAILKSHEWVGKVDDLIVETERQVEWSWNGSQPPLMNEQSRPYLYGLVGGKVISIHLFVSNTMVELWWLYGQPITQGSCTENLFGTCYFFAYPESGMLITTDAQARCASPLKALLTSGNHIEYQSVEGLRRFTNDFLGFSPMPLKTFNNRKSC